MTDTKKAKPMFDAVVYYRRCSPCDAQQADMLRDEIARLYLVTSELRADDAKRSASTGAVNATK